MTELRFNSPFASHPGRDPEAWRDFIRDASEQWWESNESFILRFTDRALRLILACEYFEGQLAISYHLQSSVDRSARRSLYAKGDGGTRDVIAKPGDVFIAKTSLLDVPRAAEVICEFIRHPTEPPSVIDWVGAGELDWPDFLL